VAFEDEGEVAQEVVGVLENIEVGDSRMIIGGGRQTDRQQVETAALRKIMRRRSYRSASAPAGSTSARSGSTFTRPTSPRAVAELVHW